MNDRKSDAELRARRSRWGWSAKAKVTHQTHGSLIVPHGSNFSAVLCAADIWHCDWVSIIDAKVEMCDQSLPVVRPPYSFFYIRKVTT